LKLIEDKVNGYDAGGMDLFRQFGYFQLSNLPRFDQYGVQIQTSAAQTAAIFFLENFVANPIGAYPQAAHFGQVSSTTVLNMLTAALSSSSASTLSLVHTGTTSTLQLLSTDSVPALILTPGAAGDPSSLQDGMFWYNDTTDKFYVRAGGVTVELGGGGGSVGVITNPRDWADSAGYYFWLVAGSGDFVTASAATNISGLDSYGWSTTALTVTSGSAGDFLSSADHLPTYIDFGASGDTLSSPTLFGSYGHMLMAAELLGATPTTLTFEAYAAFPTSSANETNTSLGFANTSIFSNGANFVLQAGAGSDVGAAVDAAFHRWKIVVGTSTTEWFIDGVSQGTVTTIADAWPTSVHVVASTTNRVRLAWLRVEYA
jgi:hypothetical protein